MQKIRFIKKPILIEKEDGVYDIDGHNYTIIDMKEYEKIVKNNPNIKSISITLHRTRKIKK